MTSEDLHEYLYTFLKSGNEDAFHSLIEERDHAVKVVEGLLASDVTDSQFADLLEILKEIRTEASLSLLCRYLSHPFSGRWVATCDAITWFWGHSAATELRKLRDRLSSTHDYDRKASVIDKIIIDLEPDA